MNSSKIVADFMGHHLPFIGGSSSDTGSTGNLSRIAGLRLNLAQLTKPSDADLATGRTIGEQMPESCAIPAALLAPPVAKDA